MKNLLTSTALGSSLLASASFADFTAAGTDYSLALAAQQEWTEDRANEFVSTPNSFACIISNSRPDILPNSDREVLIDEAACGLEDEDVTAGGVTYARAKVSSSRASNSTPQEVTSWFNTKSGDRYIADTILRSSAADVAPFGSWYFSFIKQYSEGDDETFTAVDTPEYGFVDINETDDGDVEILVAQSFSFQENANLLFEGETLAKVLFVEGSTQNTKFYGSSEEIGYLNGVNMFGDSTKLAGATNSTHYYRVSLDEDDGSIVAGSEACFAKDDKFQTTHRVKLFDPDTGAEIKLSGGFGFTTEGGGMGYLGHWGVWIDGGETLFSPDATELSITDDDGNEYTLKWAPGKLEQMSFTEEALSTGDEFRMWYENAGGDVTAVWNGSGFDLTAEDGSDAGTITETDWARWLWSDVKRQSVIWDGGDTVEMVRNDKVTFSATFDDVASTKFYGRWAWAEHTDASNLPYSWDAFSNEGSAIYWDDGQDGSRNTYFFTGSEPAAGLEPHTLYMDNGDDSLTTEDSAVRFDFGVNDSQTEVSIYSGGTEELEDGLSDWPASNLQLVLASQVDAGATENCDLNGDLSGCDLYSWQFGAMPWDQDKAAYDADGEAVELDQPKIFEVTYDSDDDRNGDVTLDIATNSNYNPIRGCSSEGSGEDAYELCSDVSPSDYDGVKFLLEFDGGNLHGAPGVEACADPTCSSDSYQWISLANFRDGTILTDTEGDEYAVLATEIGTTFLSTDLEDCDGIDFETLDELGLSDDDLPELSRTSTEYPLPSSEWADAPADEDLVCTVVHGDASDCTDS